MPRTINDPDIQEGAKRAYAIWRGGQRDVVMLPEWGKLHTTEQDVILSVYFTATITAEAERR